MAFHRYTRLTKVVVGTVKPFGDPVPSTTVLAVVFHRNTRIARSWVVLLNLWVIQYPSMTVLTGVMMLQEREGEAFLSKRLGIVI
jgi:hypothetical protein